MYSAVLSVLLMGMIPALRVPPSQQFSALALPVASPSPFQAQLLGSDLGRQVSASGVLVIDVQSGQQIYGRSDRTRRPIGSLTKLMTALIIAENHALNETVEIPAEAVSIEGQKAHLQPGSHFTVGNLLSALLIPSANDAAVSLAIFHSGSVEAFVQQMNARAHMLGLRDTSYANPAGLDHRDQWSTARDTAMLAAFALRVPVLRDRLSTPKATIRSIEGEEISLIHTHELLDPGGKILAGKTGTTPAAKQCLLSLVREKDREYLVVLLGSSERYADMNALLRTLERLTAST